MLRGAVLVLAALLTVSQPPLAAPRVTKLDPPNWWVSHSINPVRVLVRGEHLAGARVETAAPGVAIGLVRINERGTYLFVDLHVKEDARPGAVPLRIITAGGTTSATFTLDAPLARAGRFQGFTPDDVLYLVMPDRFANGDPANDRPAGTAPALLDRSRGRYYHGGDLRGIIERLPYLKDLGVTTLWLNPVYDNNDQLNTKERYDGQPITDYHGFGAVDFYAVDEHLGDMPTLRRLVDEAHALGLKVVQDQVANHTGPFHPWVTDPPTPTWFNGTVDRHLANTFQTHRLMDPGTPASLIRPTLEGWFIDILPDLAQSDEDAARYIIQNSLWWVGMTGIDGIRQDTVPYVPRWFWRDWMAALEREYPRLTVVGEVLDGSAPFVSFFQTGRRAFDGVDSGLDTLFDYPVFFALRRAFAQGGTLRDLVAVLHQDVLYPNPSLLVPLLGSHDVPRFMHEPQASIEGLQLASTFLLTMRGVPQWYYGDEIAMRGGPDPDNRRDFPGGWPGDARSAFTREGRTAEEQAVFEHVRALLHLRRDVEPLRRGRHVHVAIEEQQYVYARQTASGVALVALNNAPAAATLTVDVSALDLGEGETLALRFGPGSPLTVNSGRVSLTLPPRRAAIWAR